MEKEFNLSKNAGKSLIFLKNLEKTITKPNHLLIQRLAAGPLCVIVFYPITIFGNFMVKFILFPTILPIDK
jgi:hypothetical protein